MAQTLPQLSPQEEEDVIKRRLITRSSVTMGIPPLKRVQQRFVQLTGGLDAKAGVSALDFEKRYQNLVRELAFYELPLLKVFATLDANLREQKGYKRKREELEASIQQTEADIVELKKVLEKERVERTHKEECESIRRQIAAHPSRAASSQAIADVGEEIAALEADCAAADDSLELRKKQLALLLHAVDELQELLEEDKQGANEPELDTGPEPMAVDQPT